MAAKDVKFSTEARERMLRGVDTLENAVKVNHGVEGTQRGDRKIFRCALVSPRTELPLPRKSSLKTSSRTWARRWCAR